MKNTIVKDALILFLITAVAGVLLAFVILAVPSLNSH